MSTLTASEDQHQRQSVISRQQPNFRDMYAFSFADLPPRDLISARATPRCGSVAESGSDDDADDEIINVTDDDEVVATTTEQSLPVTHQFKKSAPSLDDQNKSTASNQTNKIYQRRPKPPLSYIALIAMAIRDSPNGKLTLAEINDYLMKKYPFFRGSYTGWRNSVRHNLSLNECFQKILRDPSRPWGKDNYWTINPNSEYTFADGVFRRRRKRISRKVACCPPSMTSMSTSPAPTVLSQRSSSSDDLRSSDGESSCSPVPFSIDSILARKDDDKVKPRFTQHQPWNVPQQPHRDVTVPLFVGNPFFGFKPQVADAVAYQQLLHLQAVQASLIASAQSQGPPRSLNGRDGFLRFYSPANHVLLPGRMVST